MRYKIIICVLFGVSFNQVFAQTFIKDASNSFALYTKSKDRKELDNAVKKIDAAYQSKKDSASYRVNLTRAMIYAGLAVADPEKKSAGKKTPLEEANYSLGKLLEAKFNDEHMPEIEYVNSLLAAVYLNMGNNASNFYNYSEALKNYKLVDSLSKGKINVTNNLAVLSEKLGNTRSAIRYYQKIIDKKNASPNYYLALASLYESLNDDLKVLEILEAGRKAHPENRDILFKEMNIYSSKENYYALIDLIKPAILMEKDNINLYYMAGFSYEMTGAVSKAIENYEKIISIEKNNYKGNYALGLLYLNKFLKNISDEKTASKAEGYLSKANQINPNEEKSLKSLLILYNATGNVSDAEKIQNKLNKITLN